MSSLRYSKRETRDDGRDETSTKVVDGYTFAIVKRTFNTGYTTRHSSRYSIASVERADGSLVDCSQWYNGSPRFGIERSAASHVAELMTRCAAIVEFDKLPVDAQRTAPDFDFF